MCRGADVWVTGISVEDGIFSSGVSGMYASEPDYSVSMDEDAVNFDDAEEPLNLLAATLEASHANDFGLQPAPCNPAYSAAVAAAAGHATSTPYLHSRASCHRYVYTSAAARWLFVHDIITKPAALVGFTGSVCRVGAVPAPTAATFPACLEHSRPRLALLLAAGVLLSLMTVLLTLQRPCEWEARPITH